MIIQTKRKIIVVLIFSNIRFYDCLKQKYHINVAICVIKINEVKEILLRLALT